MSDADVNTLTINVRHLEGARPLEVKANLFEREINKVLSLVEAHVGVMKDGSRAKEAEKRHQHDGILISGPRGSGKSTFMFTLRERLKQQYSLDSTAKWKVEQLDVLDPSLIDGDEIFLATIVARIFGHLKAAKKEEDKGVIEALKHLAPAMLALDAKATRKKLGEVASSPALFGERLLSTALSGLDVQERFAKFTHAAASALGVQFFVLYLDDVDTAFRQGSQVLETVRRYCVDGTILPILTGDEKLFQLVVREQVWRDLRQLRKAERSKKQKANIDSQVDELEGQYLLKLLRPERRLNLPGARDRLAEFKTVNLTFEDQNEGTLQARLIDANQRIFCMPSKSEGGASLPYPAGELLTQNMRQIRAVIAWLGEMPKGELSTNDNSHEGTIQSYILSMLELHPQINDSNLDPSLLTAILQKGDYQPLARWVCGNLSVYPRLYTLDPRTFGNELRDEPWRIAALAVHAALAQRWRWHPGERFAFLGTVLVPALAMSDAEQPTLASTGQPIPTSWQLSGTTLAPWEVCAKVTASQGRNWQRSREPYYLRLRINSIDKEGKSRIEEQFAARLSAPNGDNQLKAEKEQLTKGTYYSGAGPWIYYGPPRYSEEVEIIPSGAGWRHSVNKSVEYLLHWHTIPLQYYSSVLYAVDPLVGLVAASTLLSNTQNQIIGDLLGAADRDPFRIPLFDRTSSSAPTEYDDVEHHDSDFDADPSRPPNQIPTDFIQQIVTPLLNWKFWANNIMRSQNINSPRIMADCLARFRTSQISIFGNVAREYWTIGWMLQSWALAMLNAALVAEGRALQYRRLSDQPLSSTELRWMPNDDMSPNKSIERLIENRRAQQNILVANLRVVIASKDQASDRKRPTLYLVLATCPLIGGLLSEEWATLLDHFNSEIHGENVPKIPRIESHYLAGKKNDSHIKNGDEIRQFSAFSLLCGLMTPEFPVPAKPRKTGGTLSISRTNNKYILNWDSWQKQAQEASSGPDTTTSSDEVTPPADPPETTPNAGEAGVGKPKSRKPAHDPK
jgi:hypothetical protein